MCNRTEDIDILANKSFKPPEDRQGEQPTFEKALEQLEKIVHDLEDGRTGLDEALAAYERGVRLLRQCHQLLEKAERRIELLSGVDADGNAITTEMDDTASTLDEKPQRRSRRKSTPQCPAPAEKMSPEDGVEDMDMPGGLF